jgi:hypothetical protein
MKGNNSSNEIIMYRQIETVKQYKQWKGESTFLFNGSIYIG